MQEGYISLIEREIGFECCGVAATGQEALERIPEAEPDLVLIDIFIPGMSGLELIKHLHSLYPDLLLLVVSAHDEGLYAERALRAGARGYVMKETAASVTIEAIREVLKGNLYVSEDIRRTFLERYLGRSGDEPTSPIGQLTDRELETFTYIGHGMATRAIAERMHISPKTVETYRANIKSKLGVSTSAEMVQRAVLWVESQSQ